MRSFTCALVLAVVASLAAGQPAEAQARFKGKLVGELEAWVARANPSREEIAKAIDAGEIPR